MVVGDAPYVTGYLEQLRELAARSGGRIRMVGYQFGEAYRQLSYHARAFIFPTTIEATRPVLLEQMGMGSCIIARDTPSNRHILGEAAFWFSQENPVDSLAQVLKQISTDTPGVVEKKSSGPRAHPRPLRLGCHHQPIRGTLPKTGETSLKRPASDGQSYQPDT